MSDAARLNDALAANYMLVDLQLRSWSGKKTDRHASDEVIANKGASSDSGRFVKYLFAGADAELKSVQQLGNTIRAFVYAKTLPFSSNTDGAKRGDRLIAATATFEFMKELNVIKRDYDAAVVTLQAAWDRRIQEAATHLVGLADPNDYPAASSLPGMFSVSVDIRPVPVLADFARVNVPSQLAEALGQRSAEQNAVQVAGAMDDLKGQLLGQLQRMATQLKKAGEKQKTRLYDSLVTNLQDLVALTRTMNVYQNPDLTALADKIEKQLLQHPVDVYREHPEKAFAVATAADNLLVEAALEEIWK